MATHLFGLSHHPASLRPPAISPIMNSIASLVRSLFLSLAFLVIATGAHAADLDPAVQAKVDGKIAELKTWAADPVIVGAVAAHNAQLPTDHAAMNQDKWKALSLLDPFVRSFTKNPAGAFLKSKKSDWVAEAFLSDAKGLKVAFLAKTSSWSHAGSPKHDVPMTGKTWEGTLAVDESSGLQQLQVAVPVLQNGQPIGSLVVGLSLGKL